MSSLKDIMDVDVEPLESQAYRRKEAAQQQASHPSLDPSSQSPSPQLDDNRGKPSVNRRRSNRVSKSTTQTTTSRSTIPRRRSSAAAEAMDFSGFQLGGSSQGSISGSSLQTSSRGGMDQLGDVPVKYTPVTGRISRAKKGIPVHTCEDCKPAKTFTRAEHLRRHKLSHGKPAYPCTFEDCERTFHRSDLLARHLSRHETQGEKAYKASDPRSRASSSASESAPLKLEPAPHGVVSTGLSQMSPNDSMTPRTTTSSENAVTATSFNAITSTFQAINFSPGGSQTRSAPQSTLTDAEVYPPSTGAASSRMPFNYNDIPSTSSIRPMPEMPDQDNYRGSVSSFPQLYPDDSAPFTGYSAQPSLPLLRIPEDPLMPDLSYTQDSSPWCSSASDSTYSTHSDSSHIGRLVPRGRSGSLVTAPEWPAVPVSGSHWSPHGMTTTPQDLRSPPYETVMEAYETPYTPPRMSPPTRQLLDVPLGNYFMESRPLREYPTPDWQAMIDDRRTWWPTSN
ncbi:hypothetical protein ACMFMG_009052 [Clarireedia jacksonii]